MFSLGKKTFAIPGSSKKFLNLDSFFALPLSTRTTIYEEAMLQYLSQNPNPNSTEALYAVTTHIIHKTQHAPEEKARSGRLFFLSPSYPAPPQIFYEATPIYIRLTSIRVADVLTCLSAINYLNAFKNGHSSVRQLHISGLSSHVNTVAGATQVGIKLGLELAANCSGLEHLFLVLGMDMLQSSFPTMATTKQLWDLFGFEKLVGNRSIRVLEIKLALWTCDVVMPSSRGMVMNITALQHYRAQIQGLQEVFRGRGCRMIVHTHHVYEAM